MTGFQVLASVPAMLALAGSPASVGVGIQAGPVCLTTTIHPGASHALPPVTVQDTGSGDESIALDVQKPAGHGTLTGRPAPASWVTFTYPRKWLVLSQSSVSLSSGGTAAVSGRLAVPSSAKPGRYVAWIIAAPQSSTPGQVNLGAVAIADLEFTVTRPGAAPRRAVCLTPGVKHSAAHGKGHRHQGRQAAAAADPKARKVTGTEMQIAGVAVAVLAILAYLRRRT